jgi:hypothetical protein
MNEVRDIRYLLREIEERRERLSAEREGTVSQSIPEQPGVDLPAKSFTQIESTQEFYDELTEYACQVLNTQEAQLYSGIRVQDSRNQHWYRYFKPKKLWFDVVTDYTGGGGSGTSNAVINMNESHPLAPGKYYTLNPATTDPDEVFVLSVIPLTERELAQIILFRGKDKNYAVQNDLTDLTAYEDPIHWLELGGGSSIGSTDAFINVDNDYPLTDPNKYYTPVPVSDPNAVFVLAVIPTERRIVAQALAFKGKDKSYVIQNDLTNTANYENPTYWRELDSWYYTDWTGGYANTSAPTYMSGGEAASTGLHSLSGGQAA